MKAVSLLTIIASAGLVSAIGRRAHGSEELPSWSLTLMLNSLGLAVAAFATGLFAGWVLWWRHLTTRDQLASENSQLWQDNAALQQEIELSQGKAFKN